MTATTPLRLGAPADPHRRERLVRRIRLLVLVPITYNLGEAVVSLFAGARADSAALLGFGLDSAIEVSSALALAWQFSSARYEHRERVTLRTVALSFFALAAFLGYEAGASLILGQAPAHSTAGIVVALLSVVVMPTLSLLQRRAGAELGSRSAVADSKQALLCTYMSAVVLLGLVANSALGWWWADPAAALVLAALALRDGANAWRGDACCSPATALLSPGSDTGGCGCGAGCDCC